MYDIKSSYTINIYPLCNNEMVFKTNTNDNDFCQFILNVFQAVRYCQVEYNDITIQFSHKPTSMKFLKKQSILIPLQKVRSKTYYGNFSKEIITQPSFVVFLYLKYEICHPLRLGTFPVFFVLDFFGIIQPNFI